MQVKKLLSCGFAFLLVLAFAGVSLAQKLDVSDTRGTWVRIQHPADDKYAGIGDTVIVAVSTVSAATALTVQIMGPDGGDVGDDPDVIGSAIDRTLSGITADDEEITDGTLVKVKQGDENATVIQFFFPVTTTGSPLGADPIDRRNLYVDVTIAGTGSAGGEISNLTDDEQILPGATGFSTTKVGDAKTFGVDNRRPVHGTAFTRVILVNDDDERIDGAVASTESVPSPVADMSKIGEGAEVDVSLTLDRGALISANATYATVIFVKESLTLPPVGSPDSDPEVRLVVASDVAVLDSAITSVEYTDLYAAQPLVKPLDTSEGAFLDGTRVRAFAFLRDEAGNLGGTNVAGTGAPAGHSGEHGPAFEDDDGMEDTPISNDDDDNATDDPTYVNLFLIDTTTPKVTVAYPKEGATDSVIMSAAVAQSLDYYSDTDGTLGKNPKDSLLKPLTLTISENVETIKVTHGTGSQEFDRSEEEETDEFKLAVEKLVDEEGDDVEYDDAGGTKAKLTVEATDLAGNTGKAENADIFHDGIKPVIGDLFPTAEDAPKDASKNPTITDATSTPIFTNSEDLDSLFVQYVQKGVSPDPDEASRSFISGTVVTEGRVKAVIVDSLIDGEEYYLQIIAVDKAGNAEVAVTDPLTFKDEFKNPEADTFMVATDVEDLTALIVGVDLVVNIAALDSTQTAAERANVRAVTYGQKDTDKSRLRVDVSEEQRGRLEGVSFDGDDISIAEDDSLKGIATLDGDGWKAGERSVTITSEMTLTDVMVVVEDLDDQDAVVFSTSIGPFRFDSGKFAAFTVQAMEDGEETENVIGDFKVSVIPTDKFGNRSMKRDDTITSELDEEDFESADGRFKTIAIELSSSTTHVDVPDGRQEISVDLGEKNFDATASEASGQVVITAFSRDPEATGSDTLSFGPPAPPPAPGAPAAPDSVLIVEDYMGPRGDGDQGGMVLVSFNNSPDHASVDVYKLFRHLMVSTGLDEDGKLMLLEEPKLAWVPWADLSPDRTIVAEIQRAVVPALDNVPTNWAVAAVGAAGSSVRTSALGKRTFTKESVQQTLELLGMAPEAVLTIDELMNQFNAPEDYIQSIIGDQKDLVFLPVNPDVSVLMGDASVPANIRTSAHGQLMSALTTTKAPVRAVDNIAPAEVTESAGMPVVVSADGNAALRTSLTWKGSVDEGIVGFIPYRGHSIPIMGVKDYKVMRGASAEELEELTTLKPGSAQFVDKNLPEVVGALVYRIDAFDGENTSPGQIVAVNLAKRLPFTNAEGEPVYLIRLPFQGGNLTVDFEDFVAFAAAFNSQRGQSNFNPQADVDNDGVIDFADFVIAAMSYGRTAVLAAGSKIAIAPQRPGVNPDTELNMELTSDRVLVGEEISVTVSLANAEQLMGFGFELTYDADKFEFVSAVPADNDLLKSQGGDTPLFKNWPEDGRVAVVNAIVDAGSVSGEGALVTFTFKVLREFADNARFEIAQGVVFDPSQLSNPVVSLGALDVQSTPSEFALHQNFPNPFNPQTNIPYDLAESGDVVLRIYNLLGQEVRTLVSERQPAGRYKVQWAGMDDRGVSVSSGIYFYQVSVAGKFQDAKRLMLLK